jgi:hypothetical protein
VNLRRCLDSTVAIYSTPETRPPGHRASPLRDREVSRLRSDRPCNSPNSSILCLQLFGKHPSPKHKSAMP